MEQVINAYYSITASPEFREIERLREKARHDEAQALYHAKLECAAERNIEIARNLLKIGLSLDQFSRATAEIENLPSPLFLELIVDGEDTLGKVHAIPK